jgi:hypothetical protein
MKILTKMCQLFNIELDLSDPRIDPQKLAIIENHLKRIWEMVRIEMELEYIIKRFGKTLEDPSIVYEHFDRYGENIRSSLGPQVNQAFFQEALSINKRFYNERITDLKDYLQKKILC